MKTDSRSLPFGLLLAVLILAISNACLFLKQQQLEKDLLSSENKNPIAQEPAANPSNCSYGIDAQRLLRTCEGKQQVYVADIEKAGGRPENGTLNLIAKPEGDTIYFAEGAGEMGGNIWRFDIPSKTFDRTEMLYDFGNHMILSSDQTYLIEPVEVGATEEGYSEARSLRIIDLATEKERMVGNLDKSLSYAKNNSEFDSNPVIGTIKTDKDGIRIDVFSSKEKLDLLRDRSVVKQITIPICEVNGLCAGKSYK